jgi:exodeoxyribonuclease VII large subunit
VLAHAQRLDLLGARLGAPAQRLRAQRERLDADERRLIRALQPVLAQRRQALEMSALRLVRSTAVALQQRHAHVESAAARLDALDPRRVLQRGYAWVESVDGRPVTGVRSVHPGQRVHAVWADGRARADIVDVEPLAPPST